jgi:hypothetical protein
MAKGVEKEKGGGIGGSKEERTTAGINGDAVVEVVGEEGDVGGSKGERVTAELG